MVFLNSWTDFEAGAQKIVAHSPGSVSRTSWSCSPIWACLRLRANSICVKARYSLKYRHTDGKMVFKVSDDTTVCQNLAQFAVSACIVLFWRTVSQCLQYKSNQQQDLKRMEKLNSEIFRVMIRGTSGNDGDDGIPDLLCSRMCFTWVHFMCRVVDARSPESTLSHTTRWVNA